MTHTHTPHTHTHTYIRRHSRAEAKVWRPGRPQQAGPSQQGLKSSRLQLNCCSSKQDSLSPLRFFSHHSHDAAAEEESHSLIQRWARSSRTTTSRLPLRPRCRIPAPSCQYRCTATRKLASSRYLRRINPNLPPNSNPNPRFLATFQIPTDTGSFFFFFFAIFCKCRARDGI